MYHNIMSKKGSGSVRKVAASEVVSPGTVQKYFSMSLEEASQRLSKPRRERISKFEVASSLIEELLEAHPRMKAVVLLRKVKAAYPEITGKIRAFRNFLKPYREKYKDERIRFFHPVKTSKEDSQVQVDIGEFNAFISLDYVKIYFVVFVFSYSRMMFVSYQDKPYNTDDFIKAHLEAFRYFGGVAKEYVYDQTKLVCINEKYREVWFNDKFHQFALKNEFLPVVCEGYDPQSKGKVERAIGYVKSSFLECETFDDFEHLRKLGLDWLGEVANCRIHGTTGRRPDEMFEEERSFLKAYHQHGDTQICVDKTGLINYKGNKYSVPYIYQRKNVSIAAHEGRLYCYDIVTKAQIAEHEICYERYKQIVDKTHYISPEEKMAKTEQEVMSTFEHFFTDNNVLTSLIRRIKEDNHNYARQQLIGLTKIAHKYPAFCWREVEQAIFNLPKVKISVLTRLLDISFNKIDFEEMFDHFEPDEPSSSSLDRSLDVYMKKIKRGGKDA